MCTHADTHTHSASIPFQTLVVHSVPGAFVLHKWRTAPGELCRTDVRATSAHRHDACAVDAIVVVVVDCVHAMMMPIAVAAWRAVRCVRVRHFTGDRPQRASAVKGNALKLRTALDGRTRRGSLAYSETQTDII